MRSKRVACLTKSASKFLRSLPDGGQHSSGRRNGSGRAGVLVALETTATMA